MRKHLCDFHCTVHESGPFCLPLREIIPVKKTFIRISRKCANGLLKILRWKKPSANRHDCLMAKMTSISHEHLNGWLYY